MIHNNIQSEDIEVSLLLEALYLRYGYDFRKYRRASVKRQIKRRVEADGLNSIAEMMHRALFDESYFEDMVLSMTVNVTEMFRDPPFFKAIVEKVFPALPKKSPLKLWHAGCSTGEEVYSLTILLKENGLLQRTQLYATDINEAALESAREGVIELKQMREYTGNYQMSGGQQSFSDYYSAAHNSAIIDRSLLKKVLFTDHNLVTDGVFGEMDLIICRNVLIYFSKELQEKVFRLFLDSLTEDGFLGLGSKESLDFSDCKEAFEAIDGRKRIFRRK